MQHGIVDGFLTDTEDCDSCGFGQQVNRPVCLIIDLEAHCAVIAYSPFQMRLHSMMEAKQVKNRWDLGINDVAQTLDHVLDLLLQS